MFIETKRTQDKLRDLLHEDLCPRRGCDYADGDQGTCWQRANRNAVILLGRLMPVISGEMFPLVRADERGRVAGRIEAELVCCDIYLQLEHIGKAMTPAELGAITPWDLANKHGLHFHHLCYYGAWSASLALKGAGDDSTARPAETA